ncbi:hypothetical protein BD779DRAFT_1674633 [Infundibulicybe gibba]|nr:hypothetical protein BD779DRAFT_1674633 [Infundibulicybe gibba]
MSPPPHYSDNHDNSPPSGPSVAVVICAAIGSVLFVLAFSAIVVIEFTRRKRRRQDAREQLSPVGMFPKRVNASSQSIYYPQDSPGHGRMPLLDHDHQDHGHLRPPPDYKMRYNPHLTSPTHSPREPTYRPSPEDMSTRDVLEYPPLPQEPTNPCPSSYHERRPRRQKESDPIPPPRLNQLPSRSIRFQQPSDGIESLSFPEPPVTTTQDSVVAPHRHHVWHPPISKPKKIRLPRLAIPDPPSPSPPKDTFQWRPSYRNPAPRCVYL